MFILLFFSYHFSIIVIPIHNVFFRNRSKDNKLWESKEIIEGKTLIIQAIT